jgi:multisubunit Na+/H+ antiporter MnhB subunit
MPRIPDRTVNPRRFAAEPARWLRAVLLLLLVAVAAGIGLALLVEPVAIGLAPAVKAELARSGVGSEITAVLLNFRGYDTLLEITVLTAALAGVWALGPAPRVAESVPSPVLTGLNSVLVPLVVVICGYLLWAGAARSGGAFQAGSVLAAAGVLAILSGRRPGDLPVVVLRWAIVFGLAAFLGVAAGVMAGGGRFLELPLAVAGALILFVEAAATLSIAVILAGMFVGGRPESQP